MTADKIYKNLEDEFKDDTKNILGQSQTTIFNYYLDSICPALQYLFFFVVFQV